MLNKGWWRHLQWLALLAFSAAFVGWLIEQVVLMLLLTVVGCLVWEWWQLDRLERWLQAEDDDQAHLPPTGGVWQDVIAEISRLRRQNRKRKRKYTQLLERFQEATAALPDAAVILDEEDKVIWCNNAAQSLLGLTLGRDVGLPVAHLLRSPDFIAFLAQRRPSGSIDLTSPINDELMLNARVVPYGKKQRLLLATDITPVRRLEQVRRDFISNVSHELRTPLTVIMGYLETLLDNDSPDLAMWSQPLRGMRQQADRMVHLIEDLLMLARLESQKTPGPGKPVAVPALLADIVEDAMIVSGEQNHQIVIKADPQLWILGSEKELRSAFSNLIFNAVRYTPPGGKIEIRWWADERGIHLEVEDNGEGIAPHHIPRLTERFYRVNRDRSRSSGGTGLGLSIVKHVLNHHGGQLRIISELDKGSIFICEWSRSVGVTPAVSALATATQDG